MLDTGRLVLTIDGSKSGQFTVKCSSKGTPANTFTGDIASYSDSSTDFKIGDTAMSYAGSNYNSVPELMIQGQQISMIKGNNPRFEVSSSIPGVFGLVE